MSKKNKIDLSVIHEVVCEYFEIDKMQLFKKTKVRNVILARQFFQYLCRTLNPEYIVTSSYIGKYYSDVTGNSSDHATILHSAKVVKNYIEIYNDYKEMEKDLIHDINKKITYYKKDIEPKEYCANSDFKILTT